MLNNKDTLSYLQALDLSRDESKLYFELLKAPSSHLELARATGINRTKVYRLADQLEKRSLITTRTDDRGTLLVASDPRTLEVELVTREEGLKNQRAIFQQLLPSLEAVNTTASSTQGFSVQAYEGIEGFKQMLWHELKAKDKVLVLGAGSLEDLVPSKRWCESHRLHQVAAGYKIRELINPGKKIEQFTKHAAFLENYTKRQISTDIITMDNQVVIYNDTVSTYHWKNDQKVGVEVINKANAQMMRQIFEHYWKLAK